MCKKTDGNTGPKAVYTYGCHACPWTATLEGTRNAAYIGCRARVVCAGSVLDASWAAAALQALCAALRAANAKVQWNACYAAGQALRNPALPAIPSASDELPSLVAGLLDALATSGNFKARTQAAAALAAVHAPAMGAAQRQVATAALEAALLAVGGASEPAERTASDFQDVGSAGAAFGVPPAQQARVEVAARQPVEGPQPRRYAQAEEGAAVAPLSELKYTQGLIAQLQATLAHMRELDISGS